MSEIQDHDDDSRPEYSPDNSGLEQPGPLGKSSHPLRRHSTSSTALPETFQSTASNYDACGANQHYASEDTHHHPSTPSPYDPFSSPLKRRREDTYDTADSGLGSSVPDHVDHSKGGDHASYASSIAGSLTGYTVAGVDQLPAHFLERMQATREERMRATSDIVQTHWDELTSVRRSLNVAMRDVELGKLEIVRLQKQVVGLTDVLTSVQSEKSSAVKTLDVLTAENGALQTTNENLVKENERLKEELSVIKYSSFQTKRTPTNQSTLSGSGYSEA